MILGVTLFQASGGDTRVARYRLDLLPARPRRLRSDRSMVGVLSVRPGRHPRSDGGAEQGLLRHRGLSAAFLFLVCSWMLPYGRSSSRSAAHRHRDLVRLRLHHPVLHSGLLPPVKQIAEASKTGPATNIISGISVGFETTGLPALAIGAALLCSYSIGDTVDFETASGAFRRHLRHRRRHHGHADVRRLHPGDGHLRPDHRQRRRHRRDEQPAGEVRDVTDALDSAGNTTKALTKGYAVGTAALAAFLLFSAFLDEVARFSDEICRPRRQPGRTARLRRWPDRRRARLRLRLVRDPRRRRAAGDMIEEVRRQFRDDPGIMAGTSTPDYARCVDISVRGALREMIAPGASPSRPDPGRCHPALGSRGRHADGRHHRRRSARHRPQQRRRRLGQRQEVDRSGGLMTTTATCSARALTPTRRRSSATRSATPGKTPPVRRSTCLIKLMATITLVLAPLFI